MQTHGQVVLTWSRTTVHAHGVAGLMQESDIRAQAMAELGRQAMAIATQR